MKKREIDDEEDEEVAKLAEELKAINIKISAVKSEGIDDLFEKILKKLLGIPDDSEINQKKTEKKGCCCFH